MTNGNNNDSTGAKTPVPDKRDAGKQTAKDNRNNKRNNKSGKGRSDRRNNSANKGGAITSSGADAEVRKSTTASDTTKSGDPTQYDLLSPKLIEDASRINFSWPAGMVIPTLAWNEGYLAPNLMALHTVPGINFDAGKTAMWTIYSELRQVNSGAKNYGPEDVFAVILGGAQIISALNWAIRLYSMAMMYNAYNRALPDVLFAAEHADKQAFIDQRSAYRGILNDFIYQVGTISLPNFMPLFTRMAALYQNVYTEGADFKDQLYMFVPDMFWAVNLDTTSGHTVRGTVVKVRQVEDQLLTPTIVKGILTQLVTNAKQSEYFNIISGDLAKLYPNNLIQLSAIPDDLQIYPDFNFTMLEQIKNAKVYNIDLDTNNFLYTGADFQYSPQVIGMSNAIRMANDYQDLITTEIVDPSPMDIARLTRLIPHFDSNGSYICGGTEMVRELEFLSWNGAMNTCDRSSVTSQIAYMNNATNGNLMSRLTQFKYLPALAIVRSNSGAFVLDGYMHNIDNFGIISLSNLVNLHYAVALNLYYVPSIMTKK
nr:putative capsid protein [Picobirnavirus sp.]